MRPRVPLLQRLAPLIGVRVEDIDVNVCWEWGGTLTRFTPIMKHNGRVQPTRRVLYDEMIRPVEAWEKVAPACPTGLCVNPHHSRIIGSPPPSLDVEPDEGPNFEAEELSLEDLIDIIVSEDDRDPTRIAHRLDVPIDLVNQALEQIEAEGL